MNKIISLLVCVVTLCGAYLNVSATQEVSECDSAKCDTGFIDTPGDTYFAFPKLNNDYIQDQDILTIVNVFNQNIDDDKLLHSFVDSIFQCIILRTDAKNNKVLGYCDYDKQYLVITSDTVISKKELSRLKKEYDVKLFGEGLLPESISDWISTDVDRKLLRKSRKLTLKSLAKNHLSGIGIVAFNPITGIAIIQTNGHYYYPHFRLELDNYIDKKTKGECMSVEELSKNEKWSDSFRESFIKKWGDF